MSFLKKRVQQERGVQKLPWQAAPPTLTQLQAMLQECVQISGSSSQLTFGQAPEDYTLAVFKDRQRDEVHWALYRGDGEDAMFIWDQASRDARTIFQMIGAQFPGMELRSVVAPTPMTSPSPAIDDFAMQSSSQRLKAKAILEGDLKELQLANVLQSINMSKSTGRLEISNSKDLATLYIVEGSPVHCVTRQLEGYQAFIEIATLDQGGFQFYPEAACETRTIKKRLDSLLMEAASFADQLSALEEAGMTDDCFVECVNKTISEVEFEIALKNGTGEDVNACKRLFPRQEGALKLSELVRRAQTPKVRWVPILYNLYTCGLIAFRAQALNEDKIAVEVRIDWSQARAVEKTMLRSDTGLASYPAFLYALEKEMQRWERFQRPFSVIILQFSAQPFGADVAVYPPSLAAIKEVTDKINGALNVTDTLAHYETFHYAVLLPETNQASVRRLCEQIASLTDGQMLQCENAPIYVSLSCASAPEDGQTAGALLGKARPR